MSRAERPIRPFESERSPRVVPCGRCGEPTEATGAAQEVALVMSKALIARGESALKDHELARCDECRDAWRAEEDREFSRRAEEAAERLAHIREGIPLAPHERRELVAWGWGKEMERAEDFAARRNEKRGAY